MAWTSSRRGIRFAAGGAALGMVALAATFAILPSQGPGLVDQDSVTPGSVPPTALGASAAASPSGQPLAARTIVVAQAGGRDARTIAEALETAEDGDTILVLPPIDPLYGSYVEPGLTIDRDVTVQGDTTRAGGRDRIRVEISRPARPQYEDYFHDMLVRGDATIEGLELGQVGGQWAGITVQGSLTLDGVTVSGIGIDAQQARSLTVRDSDLVEAGLTLGGEVLVENSNLIDSRVHSWDNGGADGSATIVLRGNAIAMTSPAEAEGSCAESSWNAAVTASNGVLIESNDLRGAGICIGPGADGAVIRANHVAAAHTALGIVSSGDVLVDANDLSDSTIGISLLDSSATVTGNTLSGNETGLEVGAASGEVRGNDISDNRTGISFSGTTRLPLLSENRICANDVNVRIVGSAEVGLEGNDVCPDLAAGGADADVAQAVAVDGPTLSWQRLDLDWSPGHPMAGGRLSFTDGRFAMRDSEGRMQESSDGMAWTASAAPSRDPGQPFETELIGFRDGRIRYQEELPSLTIERSDGTSVKHDFRGPLSGIAVSPAGIVVIENVRRRHVIEDVLGAGAAVGDWRFVNEDQVDDPDRPDWGDQVTWWLESPEGELVELRLADHGYGAVGRDDSHIATLGWHSADGLTWTPIRGATLSWDDDILGTEKGFWWRHGNDAATSLWFSPDGSSWTRLSRVTSWRMLPWADGVVMMDGADIVAATPTGARVLDGPGVSFGEARWLEAGPLGLLLLDDARGLVAFSTDGASWSLGDVPPSWAEPGAGAGAIALGEDAVIVRIDRCSDPAMYDFSCFDGLDGASMTSELWRGTISP